MTKIHHIKQSYIPNFFCYPNVNDINIIFIITHIQ